MCSTFNTTYMISIHLYTIHHMYANSKSNSKITNLKEREKSKKFEITHISTHFCFSRWIHFNNDSRSRLLYKQQPTTYMISIHLYIICTQTSIHLYIYTSYVRKQQILFKITNLTEREKSKKFEITYISTYFVFSRWIHFNNDSRNRLQRSTAFCPE